MKKIILTCVCFLFSLFSCQNKKIEIITSNEAIVYFSPTVKKLDSLEKKFGDSFYTIADDENFYHSNALELLKKKGLKSVRTTNKNIIYLVNEKKTIKIPKELCWGGFFIYKKGKYKEFVNSINIEEWFKKNKF